MKWAVNAFGMPVHPLDTDPAAYPVAIPLVREDDLMAVAELGLLEQQITELRRARDSLARQLWVRETRRESIKAALLAGLAERHPALVQTTGGYRYVTHEGVPYAVAWDAPADPQEGASG